MARADFRFASPPLARHAGVDAPGAVFNSRCLEWFGIAITAYVSKPGLYRQSDLPGAPELPVIKAEVIHHARVLLDEAFGVCVAGNRVGRTPLGFAVHGPGDADLRASGSAVQVHVDAPRSRLAPVPAAVIASVEAVEGRMLQENLR